jgi:uncharacterized OsmC-like protein
MDSVVTQFTIHAERIDGYEFRVCFDKQHFAELRLDEPVPLGKDRHPNASRLLAASVGNCLAASLLFCLSKANIQVRRLSADVSCELVRNERRRLRIGKISVTLHPELVDSRGLKCLEEFEDFCVVTESVRRGIKVDVTVEPQ